MAKKWFSIMAVMVVLSMLLTACGADPTATVVHHRYNSSSSTHCHHRDGSSHRHESCCSTYRYQGSSAATATTVMTGSSTPGSYDGLQQSRPGIGRRLYRHIQG